MNERDYAETAHSPDVGVQEAWWGEYALETGTWGYWQVGPLALWAGRSEHEWEIAYTRDDDPSLDYSLVEVPSDPGRRPVPPDVEQLRAGFASTPEMLELRPVLADRAIVARPESAFSIPSLERVSVFVSSAVWVRLTCEGRKEPIAEIPSWRWSDTWFGDNHSGHLCYSTRSAMRVEIDELPLRPHRVVTPIVIDNQGHDTLKIERISLPIPNLSVFVSPDGALWTERLQLTRQDHAELAHVHIEHENLPVPGAVRLSEPRTMVEDGLISRVFTGLFG